MKDNMVEYRILVGPQPRPNSDFGKYVRDSLWPDPVENETGYPFDFYNVKI